MSPVAVLSFFASLLVISTAAVAPCEVYTGCSFEFCGGQAQFKLSGPNTAFTGPICIKDTAIIGRVNTSVAALIDSNAREFGRTFISRWNPPGLSPLFPNTFFKTFPVSGTTSGVGHQPLQGNQINYLDNTCWALNIVGYEVRNTDGSPPRVAKDNRLPRKNCVAWRLVV